MGWPIRLDPAPLTIRFGTREDVLYAADGALGYCQGSHMDVRRGGCQYDRHGTESLFLNP